MSGKDKLYTFNEVWQVTAAEMQLYLNAYTLDEIQVMIQGKAFSAALYKAIRPYLVERAKKIL